MTTPDPQTVYKGDAVLWYARKGLEWTSVWLVVPTTMIHYAGLPFEGWALLAIAVSMALWIGVEGVIAAGQRLGLVGTKLFPKSPPDADLDTLSMGSRREIVPVTRAAAGDDLRPASRATAARETKRIVHVPSLGAVAYRITPLDAPSR